MNQFVGLTPVANSMTPPKLRQKIPLSNHGCKAHVSIYQTSLEEKQSLAPVDVIQQ